MQRVERYSIYFFARRVLGQGSFTAGKIVGKRRHFLLLESRMWMWHLFVFSRFPIKWGEGGFLFHFILSESVVLLNHNNYYNWYMKMIGIWTGLGIQQYKRRIRLLNWLHYLTSSTMYNWKQELSDWQTPFIDPWKSTSSEWKSVLDLTQMGSCIKFKYLVWKMF